MHVVSRDVGGNASAHKIAFTPATLVGPPPPSPPASLKQGEEDPEPPDSMPTPRKPSKSQLVSRPIVFEDPVIDRARDMISTSTRGRTGSVDSRETPRAVPRSPPSAFAKPSPPSHHDLLHRSSTDTRLSTLSSRMGGPSTAHAARPSAVSDESVEMSVATAASGSTSMKQQRGHSSSVSHSYTYQSPDGYLQPPQTELDADIEDDIQMQAEQIRRERKRAKAQKDAEEALTRTASKRRGSFGKEDDNRVLVGNLIGEDHVNYVLMYNMLTGIRIAVSRCQAKIKRPLTDEDFTARHKYSFDIIGNEVTPSAKYDFKFKDYAPWVFRELREDYFQLDPADYLLSLTAKYILSELGSPGKSGSFFYFSRDYRFIIKTIRHSEHKFLLSILKEYHAHVKTNPHTLLSRFYGLHRVKLPRGRKIHFVIMNNLFPPHKDIHETYDLKGSTVGREYPEEKAQKNPRAVLKDLNWINREKMLELGPEKRALLTEQLRRDSELLKRVHVMDYSLLVGIHHVQRGNRDNVRSNTLKVFSPSVTAIRRKNTQHKGGRSPEAIAMRRAMRESDPKRLGSDTLDLPEDTGDRQHFIFYQDDGGLQATNEANDSTDTIYYLGVIDILTPPVPPSEYADRFFSFMKAIMRAGVTTRIRL
ncbi:SAICAR synthase-like protein [Melanogaster broomeanus]|nr:SAICAR synthase-like protein [Melanogaster broomeanus]